MGSIALALLLLGLVAIFHRRKKLPKIQVITAAAAGAGLAGLFAGKLATVANWIDTTVSRLATKLADQPAEIPVVAIAAILTLVWLVFEILPKAKPSPRAVVLAAILPLLFLSVPGSGAKNVRDGFAGLNDLANNALTGIIS